jgi:thioredoxin reductase (NADPH)
VASTDRPASEPSLEETPDEIGAFPRLGEQQIGMLSQYGEMRPTREGEVLFSEGDERYDFFVVLSGKVATIDPGAEGERVFAVHGPRRFLGELSLLTGQAAFFTAVVREPGEVLQVPVGRLRSLVGQDEELGDLILRAYLLRREMLIGFGGGFAIIGSRYSPDTKRLRDFAARNRLPHRWIDLEEDDQAEALLRHVGVSPAETPVVIWGGRVLRNPDNHQIARAVGLQTPRPADDLADLVVVGAGPAGLAAAVYGASEGLETVALDSVATGGQASTSSRIENYLGFPSGISGSELAERATIQAAKFGAQVGVPVQATKLGERDGHHLVTMDDGSEVWARTVVIATGARYRKLRVPRLEEFEPTSVYYAATLMEGKLCSGDPVVVVGGGNSAGQAALFLATQAAQVCLVVRHAPLDRDMSRYLVDRIVGNPQVELLMPCEVVELHGDQRLEAVTVQHCETGERRDVPARDLFVFIGADPHTEWLDNQVSLDEHGFVLTGPDAGRPLLLEASKPGVFAVGDVRHGSIKRVASAVGEGSMAIRLVHNHFENAGRR